MTAQEYNNQGFQDAAERHVYSALAEYEAYRERRDLPALYVAPPEQLPAPYTSPSHALSDLATAIAVPVMKIAVVGGIVCVIVAAAMAAVGAVFAFVSANAMWIGGGALGLAVLAGLFSGKSDEVKAPGANVGRVVNVIVNVDGNNVNSIAK